MSWLLLLSLASEIRLGGRRWATDHGIVRILVTGNRGNVGAPVAAHLESLGHDVIGYDRLDSHDLLDSAAVRRAAGGCAAVVHAGALAHDSAGSPEDVMANYPKTGQVAAKYNGG